MALFCGIDDQEFIVLYLNKLQTLSEHHIPKEQKLLVKNFYLSNKNTDPLQAQRHKVRKEFSSKKRKLKQQWETYYRLTWPQVKITKKMYNTKNITVSTINSDYEAHHIIPIHAGGINESWNITPLTPRNHKLLHSSIEEKACFSHDFLHKKFMRFILKIT